MGGLVLGIRIMPGANAASAAVEPKNPRKLGLVISEKARWRPCGGWFNFP